MTSDSDRKAAEDKDFIRSWLQGNCGTNESMSRQECISAMVAACDYGRSSALKELEQVAREAFNAGRYGKYTRNSIMPRPLLWSEVQHDFDYKKFEDYWQQKTESKEAND